MDQPNTEIIETVREILKEHHMILTEDELQDLVAEITLDASALTIGFLIETAALIWGFGFLEK